MQYSICWKAGNIGKFNAITPAITGVYALVDNKNCSVNYFEDTLYTNKPLQGNTRMKNRTEGYR